MIRISMWWKNLGKKSKDWEVRGDGFKPEGLVLLS